MANNLPIKIYDLKTYTCGNGGSEDENKTDKPRLDKMKRLKLDFEQNYTYVRSVRAIVLVHLHSHPHVLLLKKQTGEIILPGGRLRPGEDDESGIQRLLEKKMKIVGNSGSYELSELIGIWYRPQFTEQMFPYCPVHVTTPKEIEKWYLVLLPEGGSLGLSPKYNLTAVPFYDLQDNSKDFGKQLSTIPLLVSRFNIIPISIEEQNLEME